MSTAGNKITVVSKLPMALTLQLQEWQTKEVRSNQGGQWQERVSVFVGEKVRLNGCAQPPNALSVGGWPQLADGAALTFGVDEQFFDHWCEQNKDLPALKNGLIWKAKNPDYAKGTAKDADPNLKSGFEPLMPQTFDENGKPTSAGDPRLPKKTPGGSTQGPSIF
ncbi:MAG: hypothetical protein ACLP19_05250 [Xanthobacteraceae bacterium]